MKATIIAMVLIPVIVTSLALTSHAQSLYGTNLIFNGDAEAGPVNDDADTIVPAPGWTNATGSFTVTEYDAPSVTGGVANQSDPGPTNRGLSFFSGGYGSPVSTASQLVDVSAGAAAIDAQTVTFFLDGYFGGYTSQDDNAKLTATFLSTNSNVLSSITIGGVLAADRTNATGLFERSTTGLVPVGTRSIELQQTMTRLEGTYNDGYADNLALVVNLNTNSCPNLTINCYGASVVIAWPDLGGTYTLESAATLSHPTVWTQLTNGMVILAGQYYVTNSISGGSMFYRLRNF